MDNTDSSPVTVLPLQGDFNIFTAAISKDLLVKAIEAAAGDLDVDLADVSEIDTAGLQLMVMAKHEALAQGKTLRFINHSSAVLDLVDLFDLTGFFGDPVLIRSSS